MMTNYNLKNLTNLIFYRIFKTQKLKKTEEVIESSCKKLRPVVNNCKNLNVHWGIALLTSLLRTDINNGSENKFKESWNHERNVTQYIALAEDAIEKGDNRNAEKLLQKALTVNDSVNSVGVSCVYDMLATLAFRQGDLAKAEEILIKVIDKFAEVNLPEDHNSVIYFKLKLARIYQEKGQDNLAELGFKNCSNLQKKKCQRGRRDEETTKLWINILFWYGQFLKPLGRYQEARQCFETAYNLSAHISTMDTNQVMVMLYNLGEMAFILGQHDDALKHLLNAVVLGRAVNSADLASYYNKIGYVFLHKGIYSEAKKWCESAYSSSKRRVDKDTKKQAEDCLKEISKLNFSKAQCEV